MADPVKGRTEAGRRREERARRTRERITESAMRLFLERGYVATTIEEIAREAEVAAATVYQAFGTKHEVLARALDGAIAGDTTAVSLLERSWVKQVQRQRDPARRLATVIRRTAEVAARTAALKEVMRDAAATDPRVRELIAEDHARRRQTQRALVEIAVGGAVLRPGLTVDRAADTFFALVNSHSYQFAHDVLGWRLPAWQRWLVDVLTHEFLPGSTGSAAGR